MKKQIFLIVVFCTLAACTNNFFHTQNDIDKKKQDAEIERIWREAQKNNEAEIKKIMGDQDIDVKRQRLDGLYKKYKEKYGYPACSFEYDDIFWGVRKNCVFQIGYVDGLAGQANPLFVVLKQDHLGTIASFANLPFIIVIQKNKTDKASLIGQKIKNGAFLIVGTYDYSTKYRIPLVRRLR